MPDDETEALNYKYHGCNIIRLSSGAFALFLPWTNAEGMPLVYIGSMAEIEPLIMTTTELQANLQELERPSEENKVTGRSLLAALGLVKPIERRVCKSSFGPNSTRDYSDWI